MPSRATLGDFAPLPDDALTDWLMQMTPQEANEMKATWRKYATPLFRDLIDASLADEAQGPLTRNTAADVDVLHRQALDEEAGYIRFTEQRIAYLTGESEFNPLPPSIPPLDEIRGMLRLNEEGGLRRSRLSPFKWNPNLGTTGRYIAANGRMVPMRDVTRQMERVIGAVREEMKASSEALVAGEISVQRWYTEMRQSMKTIHSLSAAVAKGGWAQMSQSDWGRVGAISKAQYKFLDNFAREIISGKQGLDGSLLVRAGMYADAARGTGEEIQRHEAKRKKHSEERRVLGDADHCSTRGGLEGCLELAAKGWEPIGSLPKIGDTPCRTNCKCHFVYR